MAFSLSPPSPPGGHDFFRVDCLAPLDYGMHMPKLADRPQNPIIDGLEIDSRDSGATLPLVNIQSPKSTQTHNSIGLQLLSSHTQPKNHILSWDALTARSLPDGWELSALLSEQSDYTRAAARHYVKPDVYDGTTEYIKVSSQDLVPQLRALGLGTSSQLYTWDPAQETFRLTGRKKGSVPKLTIEGYDEVTTDSYTRRLITIGTVSRRLDKLIKDLPLLWKDEEGLATVSAFTHALSSVLMYVRHTVHDQDAGYVGSSPSLSLYWSSFAITEAIMQAVATLCGRDADKSPAEYSDQLTSSSVLLSSIWEHLCMLFDQAAPRPVIATIAYVLTVTSRPYMNTLCSSVGFDQAKIRPHVRKRSSIPDDAEDEETSFDYALAEQEMDAPSFLPPELVKAVPRAQQSLRLLVTADPEHPLLQRQAENLQVAWFWTPEEIDAAWNDDHHPTSPPSDQVSEPASAPLQAKYKAELADFAQFDLSPDIAAEHADDGTRSLASFIQNFPARLPLLTPTPSALAALVFAPLARQAALLSSTLVSTFLASEPDGLALGAHLALLRAYLLLGAPAFKARLGAALFSGAAADGLAPHADADWPPRDADLGFRLRAVIVDSLRAAAAEVGEVCGAPWRAAESRLGFAIRDLPVVTGQEGWLSPHSIEALDCLYMSYTIPRPLDVFLTPDMLSKYQRLFTFLLRLLRVEHVCHALFTLNRGAPLFPTFTRANALFGAFRLSAHALVAALAAHILDGAVRAHLPRGAPPPAGDVFALAAHHAAALDALLRDAVLRARQRTAAARVRGCLEAVLALGRFAARVRAGELEEYRAVPLLEEMWADFQKERAALMTELKKLIEAQKEEVEAGETAHPSVLPDLLLRLGGEVSSDLSY